MASDTAEPDLTPMLDVVFIMLVFFIVTATFVREIGLDVPGEDSKPRSVEANNSIVVEVNENDRYYIGDKAVDRRALEHHLARLHAEQPEKQLVIKPSPESSTDALVYAMDVGALVGLSIAIAGGGK